MATGSYDDVMAAVTKPTQPEDNPWPDRLAAWKKFSEKLHERGCKIEARYEDERDANNVTSGLNLNDIGGKRVNLFYSNTSVIKESLYNSLPKPDVSRVHKGDFENDPARVAATIVERGLSYEVRCAHWFDAAVKSAILDRLVPGLGILWVNFTPIQQRGRRTIPEAISLDVVYWKDFIYEPQRAWEQVTWAGRILHVEKAEAKKRWGEAAIEMPMGKKDNISTTEQAVNEGKARVIEMWDKTTLDVVYLTMDGKILKTIPDPYELLNFFPFPKPLIASPPTRNFLPLADYYMAQDQYLELDILYCRINLIIEAVRVAGVYDSSVPEIGRMLSGTENKLIPVDNWAMFADKGGTKGVIDWFPVEQVATVLQHLVTAFEFVKTQLFEVTGMADIIRGSSNQYETAAAQQIKAQFASVRMNAFQRDVSFFVRDTLRIMAEMMCQLYTDDKLASIVGMLPEGDDQYLAAALQIIRNDFMMKYSVDIETDSLTQADWALERDQRMAYAQSLSQFLTSSLPAAQQDPTLMPLLVQVIKFLSVGFKGSSELESMLDTTMQQLQQALTESANEPPEPSPEQIKAQAVQAKSQADVQLVQIKGQAAQADAVMKQQDRQAELEFKREEHMMDMAFKRESHMLDMQLEREKAGQKAQMDVIHGIQESRQNEQRFEDERFQDDLRLGAELDQDRQRTDAEVKSKRALASAVPKPAPRPRGGK